MTPESRCARLFEAPATCRSQLTTVSGMPGHFGISNYRCKRDKLLGELDLDDLI
jgi:hypothetical protein